jgi:hypothetical protein
VAVADRRCLQTLQCAARGVLLGQLFGVAIALCQPLASHSVLRSQTNFDDKSLAVVGAAFARNPVERRADVPSLRILLQRRFIVPQRIAGAYLLCQLLSGPAHDMFARESSHRLQAGVEVHRPQHCFHGI